MYLHTQPLAFPPLSRRWNVPFRRQRTKHELGQWWALWWFR